MAYKEFAHKGAMEYYGFWEIQPVFSENALRSRAETS